MLYSCAVTAQLICAFVFAQATIGFSHDVAHISVEYDTISHQHLLLRYICIYCKHDVSLYSDFGLVCLNFKHMVTLKLDSIPLKDYTRFHSKITQDSTQRVLF